MLEVRGLNGQIELTDTHVIIKRKGFLALATKGAIGDKSIPISAITSVQLKLGSLFTGNGFIKFSFGGAVEMESSLKSVVNDENAVIFRRKHNKDFEELKRRIDEAIIASSSRQSEKSSLSDLEKLAELKEKGVLSEEEYNSKKQELLKRI